VESTACGHHYGRSNDCTTVSRPAPDVGTCLAKAELSWLSSTTRFGNAARRHRGTGGGGDSPGGDRDRDWRQGEISKARLVPQRPPFCAVVMRSYHLVVSGYPINARRTSRSESSLAPRRPQSSEWRRGALGASVSTSSVDTTT